MAFLIGGANSAADTTFSVANSCRFNGGDAAFMSRTIGTPTDEDVWTFSVWLKVTGDAPSNHYAILSSGSYSDPYESIHLSDGQLIFHYNDGGAADHGSTKYVGIIRDPSAWYSLIVSRNGTAGKIYINGTDVTTTVGAFNNSTNVINKSGGTLRVGHSERERAGQSWNGYMAEAVFIDGQALTPTSFGEFNSDTPTVFQPIDVSGLTFGDNGFYLDFEDSGDLGDDESGNTNDFTESNLAATDQATDTPTNNFCTLNPLATSIDTTNNVLKEGNLIVDHGDSNYDGGTATFGFLGSQGGKWYWEVEVNADSAAANQGEFAGINMANEDHGTVYDAFGTESHLLATTGSNIIYKKDNSAVFTLTDPAGFSAGDHINVALDLDNNKIWFGLNGTFYDMSDGSADGDPAGNSGGATVSRDYDYLPYYRIAGTAAQLNFNFGNPPTGFAIASGNADGNGYGNFEYAPPSGFLALCSKNLGGDS